jgi:hypothetical protein
MRLMRVLHQFAGAVLFLIIEPPFPIAADRLFPFLSNMFGL